MTLIVASSIVRFVSFPHRYGLGALGHKDRNAASVNPFLYYKRTAEKCKCWKRTKSITVFISLKQLRQLLCGCIHAHICHQGDDNSAKRGEPKRMAIVADDVPPIGGDKHHPKRQRENEPV